MEYLLIIERCTSAKAKHYDEQMTRQNTNRTTTLGPYGKTIRSIQAFRSTYLDLESDLSTMSSLGIRYVRVPVSWCWTDAEESDLVKVVKVKNGDEEETEIVYMGEEEVKEKFMCRDPFYPEVYWPASEYVFDDCHMSCLFFSSRHVAFHMFSTTWFCKEVP